MNFSPPEPESLVTPNGSRIISRVGVASTRGQTPAMESVTEGPRKYVELGKKFAELWTAELHDTDTMNLTTNYRTQEETERILNILRLKEEGVQHGYMATGRFIGLSVMAYIKSTRKNLRDVNKLEQIFLHRETVSEKRGLLQAANMHNEVNKLFEEGMGLIDGSYEMTVQYGLSPIEVGVDKNGEFFRFNPMMELQLVGSEVMGEAIRLLRDEPDRVCPAQKFIPYALAQMVRYSAADPRFFEVDLST